MLVTFRNRLVRVFQGKPDITHSRGVKLTAQVRGIERKQMYRTMKNMSASNYRSSKINELSSQVAATGILKNVKSSSVLRCIRSEQMRLKDRAQNDLEDLIRMRNDNLNICYIQKVGDPLFIHIYSVEQIQLIKRNLTLNQDIYCDATGSVVRQQKKRWETYSLLCRSYSFEKQC